MNTRNSKQHGAGKTRAPDKKRPISRCFSRSGDEFTFSQAGFHGSLLSNMMGGIRDLTFYNIFDKEKTPVKVTSIQLNSGNLHLAHCLDESNGKRWCLYTRYLAVLDNGCTYG